MTDPLWQASMMQCSLQPWGRGFTNHLFSSSSMIIPAYSQKVAALIMLDKNNINHDGNDNDNVMIMMMIFIMMMITIITIKNNNK